MNSIAVIPARSGSKGLKDKNIRLLNGKPLLAYSIEAARNSKIFSEIFVSTDSEKYAEIAQKWGADVPFLRSNELSTDTASPWDVLRETIRNYKKNGKEFDLIALLQPTSPLRSAEDIILGYNKIIEKNANVVISVCEVDHSPLLSNTLPEDASLSGFINKDAVKVPRQKLPVYYRINGALYFVKTEHLMNTEDIYDDKSYAVIMPKERSADIDNEIDFLFAEMVMKIKNKS